MSIYLQEIIYDSLQSAVLKSFKSAVPAYREANIFSLARGNKNAPTFSIPRIDAQTLAIAEAFGVNWSAELINSVKAHLFDSFNESEGLSVRSLLPFSDSDYGKKKITDTSLPYSDSFSAKGFDFPQKKSIISSLKKGKTSMKIPINPEFIYSMAETGNLLRQGALTANSAAYGLAWKQASLPPIMPIAPIRQATSKIPKAYSAVTTQKRASEYMSVGLRISHMLLNTVQSMTGKRYYNSESFLLDRSPFILPIFPLNSLAYPPKTGGAAVKTAAKKTNPVEYEKRGGFGGLKTTADFERDLRLSKKQMQISAPILAFSEAYSVAQSRNAKSSFLEHDNVFSKNFFPFIVKSDVIYENNVTSASEQIPKTKEILSTEANGGETANQSFTQNKALILSAKKKTEENVKPSNSNYDLGQSDLIESVISALTEVFTETSAISTEGFYD